MNHRKVAALATVLLLTAAPALAQEYEKKAEEAATATAEAAHVAIAAADVVWGPAPEGLPAGSELAVLSGDPSEEGLFIMRAKLPDGYRVPPHSHPKTESVTVISGTLGISMGETLDEAAGTELGPGGLFVMPAETAHAAWAKGETVIQINAEGPWGITYVNPADDPRTKTGEGAVIQE